VSRSWGETAPRTHDIQDLHSWATPDRQTPVWLVLLTTLTIGVLFLAAVIAGRTAMCELRPDEGFSYCADAPAQADR
jgi:hypothetical protein